MNRKWAKSPTVKIWKENFVLNLNKKIDLKKKALKRPKKKYKQQQKILELSIARNNQIELLNAQHCKPVLSEVFKHTPFP